MLLKYDAEVLGQASDATAFSIGYMKEEPERDRGGEKWMKRGFDVSYQKKAQHMQTVSILALKDINDFM